MITIKRQARNFLITSSGSSIKVRLTLGDFGFIPPPDHLPGWAEGLLGETEAAYRAGKLKRGEAIHLEP